MAHDAGRCVLIAGEQGQELVERLLAGTSASIAPHPVLVPEDPPSPWAPISIYAHFWVGACHVVGRWSLVVYRMSCSWEVRSRSAICTISCCWLSWDLEGGGKIRNGCYGACRALRVPHGLERASDGSFAQKRVGALHVLQVGLEFEELDPILAQKRCQVHAVGRPDLLVDHLRVPTTKSIDRNSVLFESLWS